MSKPVCVVWMNEAKVYEQALSRAGLTEKFELHTLKLDEKLDDDVAERTEILVGWRAGSHLRRMPRLRWVQPMTSGVEAWLGHPDLAPGRDDLLRARFASPVDAREHPRRDVPPHEALYGDRARSAGEPVDQRKSVPLAGKTLGILGLGAIGQELARKELHSRFA